MLFAHLLFHHPTLDRRALLWLGDCPPPLRQRFSWPTVQLFLSSVPAAGGSERPRAHKWARFLHTRVFGPVLRTPSNLSSPSVLNRIYSRTLQCSLIGGRFSKPLSSLPTCPFHSLTLGCRARLRPRLAQLSSPLCSDEHLYENQCLRRRTARDRIRICCVYSVFTVLLCVVLQL